MSDYPMLISNKLHSFRNFRIQYAKTLYNTPALSVGTYIHQELCNGLEKGLNRYQKLSGSIAFQKLCEVGKIIR